MQSKELLSGYSDLLRQFKDRTGTETDIENLNVIFYLEDYDLVAVENDGEHVMVLAICAPKKGRWRYELIPGSEALRMIKYFCEGIPVEDVPAELNGRLENVPKGFIDYATFFAFLRN